MAGPTVRFLELGITGRRHSLAFELEQLTVSYSMTWVGYMVWNAPNTTTTVLLAKQVVHATRIDEWFYENVEDKIVEAKNRLPTGPNSLSAVRREALADIRRQSVQVYTLRYLPAASYTAVSRSIQSPVVVTLPKGWGYIMGVQTVWSPFSELSFKHIRDSGLAVEDGTINADGLSFLPLI